MRAQLVAADTTAARRALARLLVRCDVSLCRQCAARRGADLTAQLNAASADVLTRLDVAHAMGAEATRFAGDAVDLSVLRQQCAELASVEAQLAGELDALAREDAALAADERRLTRAEEQLAELVRAHRLELDAIDAERQTIAARHARADAALVRQERRLQLLACASVYNDTFFIWHAGHFATINGHRLGRLPSQPVDWRELNAAFGAGQQEWRRIGRRTDGRVERVCADCDDSHARRPQRPARRRLCARRLARRGARAAGCWAAARLRASPTTAAKCWSSTAATSSR